MTKVQAEEVVPENTVLTLPEESRGTGKTNIRDDYELILVEPQPQNIATTYDANTEKLDTIIVTLAVLQENQKILAATQQTILQQTAAINTQLEELVRRALIPQKQKSFFKPISSYVELQNFEDQLRIQNFQ